MITIRLNWKADADSQHMKQTPFGMVPQPPHRFSTPQMTSNMHPLFYLPPEENRCSSGSPLDPLPPLLSPGVFIRSRQPPVWRFGWNSSWHYSLNDSPSLSGARKYSARLARAAPSVSKLRVISLRDETALSGETAWGAQPTRRLWRERAIFLCLAACMQLNPLNIGSSPSSLSRILSDSGRAYTYVARRHSKTKCPV